LVSPEVFSWGYHGGFGYLTRTLGREFADRGVEVCVVTVRRGNQGEVEELDGFKVLGYPSIKGMPGIAGASLSRLRSLKHYRKADCDIYHSQAVSYNTVAAMLVMRDRIHAITFQDPYDLLEYEKISRVDAKYTVTTPFRARFRAEIRALAWACNRADVLFAQARFLVDKAVGLFNLSEEPAFLPNPVEVPCRRMVKAETPTVCFLARWDPQKRVELFFELARAFPDIRFVAMGHSHDPATDAKLRHAYGKLPNLDLVGFVSEDEKSRILEESWCLVNTSVREALPVSFLEALAHETPIISGLDPDGLTSRYGYPTKDGSYSEALRRMLADERRRSKGMKGRRYVEEVHEVERVVDRHLEIYGGLLEGRK